MARRNTNKTELELLEEDIQAQKDRLTQLKNKKKVLLEADNIRLGKLIRRLFDGILPESPEAQERFFGNIAKSYRSTYNENRQEMMQGQDKPSVGDFATQNTNENRVSKTE